MGTRYPNIAVAVALAVLPATASAQATEDSLLNECFSLRTAGRHAEALPRCEQAVALSPSGRTLGQLALTEFAAARYVDAAQHLTAALADTAHPWVQRNRAALEDALRATRPHVAELRVDAGASDASLLMDGRAAGPVRADAVWFVPPGTVTLMLRTSDGRETTRTVTLTAGTVSRERFDLASTATTARATPPQSTPHPPAEAPSRATSTRRVLAWVAAGGAVAGFGLALASWRVREGIAADHNTQCPNTVTTDEALVRRCTTAWSQATGDLGTWDAVSAAGLAVGGALAVASVVLFVTEPRATSTRTSLACGGLGTVGVRCTLNF